MVQLYCFLVNLCVGICGYGNEIILKTTVYDDDVMQVVDMVKAPLITTDSDSKNSVNLPTSTGSSGIIDVESLPELRTTQYEIAPYKKIVVFSASRTGSSLVYNICRFLFEKGENFSCFHNEFNQNCLVLKTHIYSELNLIEEKDVLYVVPIRNPIDACISHYRISESRFKETERFARKIMKKQGGYLSFCDTMKNEGKNVVFVKYEDFGGNIDYLLEFFENYFSLSILTEDREMIKKGYAKENIYKAVEEFANFKNALPISGFHGKHVSLEKYTPPERFLEWLNDNLQEIKPIFMKYGYVDFSIPRL